MSAPHPVRALGVRAIAMADMARMPRALQQAALDVEALAAVPLTGGHLRNTIVRAAFLAAEDGTAVGMRCCRPAYVIASGAAKLIALGAAKLIVPGRPE